MKRIILSIPLCIFMLALLQGQSTPDYDSYQFYNGGNIDGSMIEEPEYFNIERNSGSLFSQGQFSLTTTFADNNGCDGGNMFDLTNIGAFPVILNGFDVNSYSASQTVNIYYTAGGYGGKEAIPGAWTLMGSSSQSFNPRGTPSHVDIGGLVIYPGETYGIFVNLGAAYTNGTALVSDGQLQLSAGIGLCGAFSGFNIPRTWNGTVYYSQYYSPEIPLSPWAITIGIFLIVAATVIRFRKF